ncbi:hypothetical protein BaRGS_00037188 [Batillaria attramentaria]|uniref:Uncharacterized protein n=1 Tax=Batillaria attramentaria TaxID=370345 RepID=A0ABD0J9P3_9CAEN
MPPYVSVHVQGNPRTSQTSLISLSAAHLGSVIPAKAELDYRRYTSTWQTGLEDRCTMVRYVAAAFPPRNRADPFSSEDIKTFLAYSHVGRDQVRRNDISGPATPNTHTEIPPKTLPHTQARISLDHLRWFCQVGIVSLNRGRRFTISDKKEFLCSECKNSPRYASTTLTIPGISPEEALRWRVATRGCKYPPSTFRTRRPADTASRSVDHCSERAEMGLLHSRTLSPYTHTARATGGAPTGL